MEREKIDVVYSKRAAITISMIALYVSNKGYPETAQKYRRKLYEFGNSLAEFPNLHAICRHKVFQVRKYRCALFDNHWVFAYKVVKDKLRIVYIRHTSLLK